MPGVADGVSFACLTAALLSFYFVYQTAKVDTEDELIKE